MWNDDLSGTIQQARCYDISTRTDSATIRVSVTGIRRSVVLDQELRPAGPVGLRNLDSAVDVLLVLRGRTFP